MRSPYVLLAAWTLMFASGPAWARSPDEKTTIVIAGSERMVPLVRKLTRRFSELHPERTIEVRGGGSIVAVTKLTRGEATFVSLARPANDDEAQRVRRMLKQELVGIPIAMDAVVFFVHPSNPVVSLSFDQIRRIFAGNSADWTELGFPLERMQRMTPTVASGSVDVVALRVLHGKGYTGAKTEHKDGRSIRNAVSNEPTALGFAGMGDTRGVKVVLIQRDTASSPVLPTPETVRSRAYPLAHYLYLYFAGQPTGTEKDFLRFALSPEGQEIVRASGTGAVPLPFLVDKASASKP